MNGWQRNIALIIMAALTLTGSLISRPIADAASTDLTLERQSAEAVSNRQTVQPLERIVLKDTSMHDNQAYIALDALMKQTDGFISYNNENDTVDIVMNDMPFSLLLREQAIMSNGYEIPGDFYIADNGDVYLSVEQAAKLSKLNLAVR
ncbi:hypothetical protein [Paenibacillus chungangensis]|uniref:Copper amine oxidase-like N-terminal domain-containing protein n=1 Tax=Paenibacillus chungangensis TaxID=696535 RepID=A0ABW3HQK3_9BACL